MKARYIPTTKAAQIIGVHRSTLVRWIRWGAIPATTTPRGYAIDADIVAKLAAMPRMNRTAAIITLALAHNAQKESHHETV
jgi:excisionase family DNA binding protein